MMNLQDIGICQATKALSKTWIKALVHHLLLRYLMLASERIFSW
jgi:hypothetical protein